MARVQFGGGITKITGKLAGSVFQGGPGGSIIRTLSVPSVNTTLLGVVAQNLISILAVTWSTILTDPQRTRWNSASLISFLPHMTRKGMTYKGRQYFHQVNLAILKAGGTIIFDPPPPATEIDFTSATFAVDSVAGTMIFTWSPAVLIPPYVLELWTTGPYNAANNYASNTVKFQTAYASASSPLSFVGDWQNKHGGFGLVRGMKIFLVPKIVNANTGAISAPVLIVATIT